MLRQLIHPAVFLSTWAALAEICLGHPFRPSNAKFEVRIVSGPHEHGNVDDFELSASRGALLRLKDHLGAPGLMDLLRPDIDRANAAWKAILANSTGGHIPSETRVQATGIDATTFAAWFAADTGDPHKMIGAHPDHFVEEASAATGDGAGRLLVNVVETWGHLVTHFVLPSYGDNPRKPWMRNLPEFPFQASGDAVLEDGTVFASIHNSFRDLPGRVVGVEAILAVWLPDSTPENVVESLRQHQGIEFSNWLRFAYRDVSSGKFSVTTSPA